MRFLIFQRKVFISSKIDIQEVISMPRQGKNIYLRKDGRWEGRYQKDKINGKTKYGYVFGKTYEEAEQKLDAVKAELKEPTVLSSCSFESVSLEWLTTQKPQLKTSSYAKYTNLLNSYLIPSFGAIPIQSITRNEAMKYSRELLASGGIFRQGLAPKTVNSIVSVLKNVLEYASRELGISSASIGDISVRQPQKPMRILSRLEQTTLSDQLRNEPSQCNLGILLCLYTGMRIGEICALTWGDINIEEQFLFVHRSMQRVQTGEKDKKQKSLYKRPRVIAP